MYVSDPPLVPVRAALLACAALFPTHAAHALQAADYQRAERVHDSHLRGALRNASVLPHWLADGRFWYERETTQGRRQAVLVDPVRPHARSCSNPMRWTLRLHLSVPEDHACA